jgi:hypothetical protein
MPRMSPFYTNIVNPDVGVTKVKEGWVGEKDYANQTYSTQQRLKIHNLSQYLSTNTFKNPCCNYGAYAKSHSSFLFINIGLLHLE